MNYLKLKRLINFAVFLSILIISVSTIGFCKYSKVKNRMAPPPASTMDSLQGKWQNVDDTLNQIIFTGRNWNQKYKSTGADSISETYKVYFSDTLIQSADFSTVHVDTAKVSGKFLIPVTLSDNSMSCFYLNGFYTDATGTTLSISVNYPAYKKQVFKKIQ